MPTALTRFFHRHASPAVFLRICRVGVPVAAALSALLLGVGMYLVFFVAPPDYQQGYAVRIMYIHVPAAILSSGIYGFMTILAISTLIWKHTLADVLTREAAWVGAAFTIITLATGSLWGKPMWGAYWVWDARLTSVALLLLIYAAIIVISRSTEGSERGRTSAAWLVVVGSINLPIIRFSVEWWNTLHQPASLLREGGAAVHETMLYPLLLCIAGFVLLAAMLVLVRAEAALCEQKLRRLQRQAMLVKTRAKIGA